MPPCSSVRLCIITTLRFLVCQEMGLTCMLLWMGWDGMYLANVYPKTCSLVSIAPVNYYDELYKKIPTYENVVKALQGGFDLGWSVECRDCSLAGKSCVYGPEASRIRPIIFECQKEYHELTEFEGKLIIVPIAVGGFICLVIIVVVSVCVTRKCKKRKQQTRKDQQKQQSSTV